VRKSSEAGFMDYIVKPVNFAQLQAVIERVVDGEGSSNGNV
jgi:DNA-binding response OmpR family regulator